MTETVEREYRALVARFGLVAGIDLNEAGEITGRTREQMLADYEFPVIKIGGRYKVPLVELACWMDADLQLTANEKRRCKER